MTTAKESTTDDVNQTSCANPYVHTGNRQESTQLEACVDSTTIVRSASEGSSQETGLVEQVMQRLGGAQQPDFKVTKYKLPSERSHHAVGEAIDSVNIPPNRLNYYGNMAP